MSASGIAAKPAGRVLGGRLGTLAVIVVTAVVIGLVAYIIDQPAAATGVTKVNLTDTSATPPQNGQVPPDFQATTVDGKSVSLSQLKGQPVWLTFGASWCGDCRAEAPDLEATYAKFKDKGLVVVAVSIQEDAAAVQEYAKRIGFTFTMVPDPDTTIADRYHILGIPTHYFIGRDGVIREVRLGGLKPAEMERLVGEILG